MVLAGGHQTCIGKSHDADASARLTRGAGGLIPAPVHTQVGSAAGVTDMHERLAAMAAQAEAAFIQGVLHAAVPEAASGDLS